MIVYGQVTDIKYASGDFYILRLQVHKASPASPSRVLMVSGNLYGLLQVTVGATIGFIGEMVNHPKYGLQLKPSGWEPYGKTAQDVERFLGDCIDGFGNPDMVTIMVDEFGVSLYETMITNPDQVRALFDENDPIRVEVERALDRWRETRILANLASLLGAAEIPEYVIMSTYRKFGDTALQVVRQNPYRLIQLDGVSFSMADALGRQVGIESSDIRRIEGAILWCLYQGGRDGHLFTRRADLPGRRGRTTR